MAIEPRPFEIIEALAGQRHDRSEQDILDELVALPPLADEDDARWDDDAYWRDVAYLYIALADVAAARRLRPAVRLLLDRACDGDPGEIMRGLRHSLEAIAKPDWSWLAEVCIEAIGTRRAGTVRWALHELMTLEDERARPIFEELARSADSELARMAQVGLERLGR